MTYRSLFFTLYNNTPTCIQFTNIFFLLNAAFALYSHYSWLYRKLLVMKNIEDNPILLFDIISLPLDSSNCWGFPMDCLFKILNFSFWDLFHFIFSEILFIKSIFTSGNISFISFNCVYVVFILAFIPWS